MEIPCGFCQCGCGQKTTIPQHNDRKYVRIKGQPNKFATGHDSRTKGKCYLRKYLPNHPMANTVGTIRKERLIIENILGKILPCHVVIHHINKKITDNDRSNLVLCENSAYHHLLHRRERAFKKSGHANWRKCNYCHQYDSPEHLKISPNGKQIFHLKCRNEYAKNYRRGKTNGN